MNKLNLYIFLSLATLSFGQTALCQLEFKDPILKAVMDSAQRIKMKETLKISDAQVSEVFAIRDNYLNKVEVTRSDSSFSPQHQNQQIALLSKQTNQNIEAALGDAVYKEYKKLIKEQMKKRKQKDTGVLAGDIE